MKKFEFFEHTGDTGVTVFGASSTELFTHAAEALCMVFIDPRLVQSVTSKQIAVEAENYEELLVAWLNELLYIFETESLLLCRYDIEQLDDRHVTARVWGEWYEEERHPINRVIKAVTYHQLSVTEHDGQWEARIIFDL